MKDYVFVIGCPKSGTVYFSEVLKANGCLEGYNEKRLSDEKTWDEPRDS